MSRCFPFPPPGYEKKIRPDSANLIIKEKHKKPKKDKEKKERSEGKEKVKSEKHKDDKDRKEKKHRDRKHKKRDKHKSSEEKNNAGSSENLDGERLVSDDSKEIEDSRILVELGKRLRNDDGAMDTRMVQKITPMDQRKPKLLEKVEHHNDHKVAGSYEDTVERRDVSKMANSQYLKADARDLENGFVANQNKVEGAAHKVDMFHRKKEENEKIKHRSNDVRCGERKHEQREGKKAGDKKSSMEIKKEKMESIKEPIKQIGNNSESVDFREPSNGSMKKVEHQGSLPKHKAPESNGFFHVNGIQPTNMARAVSYLHQDQGSQNRSGSNARQNSINIAARTAIPSSNHMVNGKPVGSNVICPVLGQRTNNFTSDHGRATTNNHLVSKGFLPGIGKKTEPCQTLKAGQRIISNHGTSDHGIATTNNHVVSNGSVPSPHVDMGKKTEPCRTPKVEQRVAYNHRVDENNFPSLQPSTENERKVTIPNSDKALDWRGQDGKTKIDEKDSRKNGIKLDGANQHTSSKPSSSSSTKAKEKSEKSRKDKSDKSMKSHPDLKYLDQILTVPRVDWPISDDQEWLFGRSEPPAKRPKLAAPSLTEPTKEVWAKAMRLESADVIALPYVVPY